MHKAVQAHFQALGTAVGTTAIGADRKHVIASRIERLSGLYTRFGEANESRYFDEINSLVQLLLRELEACPKAQKLDATFREKLRILHEELGLPPLKLKPPPTETPEKKPSKKRTRVAVRQAL
jgi:hypothetical protein